MKNLILNKLKETDGFLSGEELSGLLGVSRTAVWKQINELRKEGYAIESSSKKGYKLNELPDLLDEREIRLLPGQQLGSNLIHLEEVDSTNNYAKKIANDNCPHGTVVIAEKQTLGRGRVGRTWESESNNGLWFSIILRPSLQPEEVQLITLAASVAVVEGIYGEQGVCCGIKWPNDIILDNCKLCGILTELSAEPGHVNHVIVGIGVNVNQDSEDFGAAISGRATSLKIHTGHKQSRVRLLESILSSFDEIYLDLLKGNTIKIIERWNKYSVTLGKEIRVVSKDVEYFGVAQSIASDGKLVVKCKDGTLKEISAGEVQVRGLMGYT